MHLEGTPSENLPDVLATGKTDISFAYISLSAREPAGRDADYIEWHSLDHRPEQARLPELRNSLRIVSTADCRAARAASVGSFDAVDHVMTYMFSGAGAMPGFSALGLALHEAGRMPLRLPSIGYMTANLAGRIAAPRAVAGADVLPWRPALGVYLIIEEGHASPAGLIELPGVAGVWWFAGAQAAAPNGPDARSRQITYCYLDTDPVAAAAMLGEKMRQRWASGEASGLLAAPFYSIVPYDWTRYLPG